MVTATKIDRVSQVTVKQRGSYSLKRKPRRIVDPLWQAQLDRWHKNRGGKPSQKITVW